MNISQKLRKLPFTIYLESQVKMSILSCLSFLSCLTYLSCRMSPQMTCLKILNGCICKELVISYNLQLARVRKLEVIQSILCRYRAARAAKKEKVMLK